MGRGDGLRMSGPQAEDPRILRCWLPGDSGTVQAAARRLRACARRRMVGLQTNHGYGCAGELSRTTNSSRTA